MKKRASKKARTKKSSIVKSVFLYGNPNKEKLNELTQISKIYADGVNGFINTLCNDKSYLKEVLLSSNKSPSIRKLEKDNRISIGSAYGQSSIDYAMVKASQYANSVHKKVMCFCQDKDERSIAGSILLYTLILQGNDYTTIIDALQKIMISDKDVIETLEISLATTIDVKEIKSINSKITSAKNKLNYHQELLELIKAIGEINFNEIAKNITMYNEEAILEVKIPTVKRCEVQLDSRLFTLENPDAAKSDKVVSIKGIGCNKRIQVPLYGSREGLRRLSDYTTKKAITFSITKNGKLKVAVPFEKKVDTIETDNYVGVDVGITDLLHTSEFGAFGTVTTSNNFYCNEVEKVLGNKSTLRNQMREYQKLLHNYKGDSEEYKNYLRKKICNINTMLQKEKKSKRYLNRFHAMQDKDIKDAVNEYVTQAQQNPCCTVLELLDIDEFDSYKSVNERRSLWARAKITDRLMDTLEWYGLPYMQVEPAYTSKTCPVCNNIDKKNRDGKRFKCTCCGYEADADYNASINIKNRATDNEVSAIVEEYQYSTRKRHDAILELFKSRHEEWIKQST